MQLITEAKMDEALAKKILKETKEVLDANNVEYWLNFGALLGAVREGGFIPHDDDIELNAWAHKVTEPQMRKVSKELCQRGFNVYYSTLTDYISIWKHNINIAFSMYTLRRDKAERPHEIFDRPRFNKYIYWGSEIFAITRVGKINRETFRDLRRVIKFLAVSFSRFFPETIRRKIAISLRHISIKLSGEYGKTKIPARFYLQLRDLDFYDMTFKVPSDTEEYLKLVYGPGWRVPMKDWKFYEHQSVSSIDIVDEIWDYK